GERNVLGRVGYPGDDAGVLLREKALGYLHVQNHRRGERDEKRRQGGALVIQTEIQTARISGQEAIEGSFDRHIGLAVLGVLFVAQEQGAHGRGKRQRDEG